MFQIETALLDFQDQGMSGSQSDKTSVIKRLVGKFFNVYRVLIDISSRLFYGKKRQRLTPLTEADARRQRSSSSHEKEDLFSHLHLNVSDESFDLYDGLSRYFDDVVELDGVKKRMEVTLVDLPPLLQVQLQVHLIDSVFGGILTGYSTSAYNSTVRRNKHISLKHMSSLVMRSAWTASWIAQTQTKEPGRKRFSQS